jgi:hypothetical protein
MGHHRLGIWENSQRILGLGLASLVITVFVEEIIASLKRSNLNLPSNSKQFLQMEGVPKLNKQEQVLDCIPLE